MDELLHQQVWKSKGDAPLISLLSGDCRAWLRKQATASIGAVVCDPPYALTGAGNGTTATGFLGIRWDRENPATDEAFWQSIFRVLTAKGCVKAFSAPRTYHRVATAMEAAGFVVTLEAWGYAGGFPKSVSLSKSIDAKILTGKSNSVALSRTEVRRPVVGSVRRVVSSGRHASEGTSRHGVQSNMERWLNTTIKDIPVTSALTTEAKLWEGWGTQMRPAWEPILVGRKP